MQDEFRAVYERHVGYVLAGDVKSALADIVQENLPTIFEGVDFPKGAVDAADIKDVRCEGDRAVGEVLYRTPDRTIGLRSIWERRDGAWKSVALENFPVEAGAAG